MNKHRAALLLPFAALSLAAQAPKLGFDVQASLLIGTGDMKKMSEKNPTGLSLGGALRYHPDPDLGFRLHLDLASIKGVEGSGLSSSKPTFLGLDVMREAGRWTFYGGLLGTRWNQDEGSATLNTFSDAPDPANNRRFNNFGSGTKLGARVGLEFEYRPGLRAHLAFTQSEFNKMYQPSWISVGATWRFASF